MKKLLVSLTILTSMNLGPTNALAQGTTGRCTKYEAQLVAFAPKGGWDVRRMSGYMWRESRCVPTVRSKSRDTGLLQINDVNLPYLSKALGFQVTQQSLTNPTTNIKAAAALCEIARKWWGNCYRPWKTSR